MAEEAACILEKLFKIKAKGSSVRTEVIAGITTFVALSYIIFVNPSILSQAGIPQEAAFASTVWAAAICSLLMGLWANFPIAVAPGMGLNAFFTYTVVLGMGLSWQTALGAVFVSGIVFLLLTLGGIRQAIINAVPMNLKLAIGVGVGIFVAFVGLQGAGIIVANPATLTSAGHIANIHFEIGKPAPLLSLVGLLVTAALMARGYKSAILLGIIFTTLLGMAVGATPTPTSVDSIVSWNFPSFADTFMQMDISGAIAYGLISIIFTFTVVELFDNMGTLIGLTKKAGLMKKDGSIEGLNKALIADAIGTMASAAVGTSTVTSYVESASGIAAGGRTGLTAVVVAILFVFSLFFAPFVGFVPSFATAPALIIVGALMMTEIVNISFDDITEAVPCFLTIVMMPFTYSIANGFAFGFTSFMLIKLLAGRIREVSPVMVILSIVFMINFVLRLE